MKINDENLQKEINKILGELSNISKNSINEEKLEIKIDFKQKKPVKFLNKVLYEKEEEWEKWIIFVTIEKYQENKEDNEDKVNKIRDFIADIIEISNAEQDSIPEMNLENFEDMNNNKIKKNNSDKFLYKIDIKKGFENELYTKFFSKLHFSQLK